MTGCQCNPPSYPFYCPRHRCTKTDALYVACQTDPQTFAQWERGAGPSVERDAPRGLGDTLARVFKATGVDRLAKFVAKTLGKQDCGCHGDGSRQDRLNELVPYEAAEPGDGDRGTGNGGLKENPDPRPPTPNTRRVILHCNLSPGDVVVMTAAVAELHRQYPGRFETDVRTPCPAIWEHNPDITPIADDDGEKVSVYYSPQRRETRYAHIHESNRRPIHFIEAFCEGLSTALNLAQPLRPTIVRGVMTLSDDEKKWPSQIQELTGRPTRYWIVNAGRKSDFPTKQWPPASFQEVIDRTRQKITWIQIGEASADHFHPDLQGVIDLRGQTDLRQLIRLVYHAEGMLTGVSLPMHLAAAVPRPEHCESWPRPCIVIAGGREPQAWNTYPGQQLLHTVGSLDCCAEGGCWKSRLVPIDDADVDVCRHVVDGHPLCMRMIEPERVADLILQYVD